MPSCPGLLDPVCQAVGGASSTVLGAGADGVLGALSNWVVGGAGWLLDQVGGVLSTTTSIDVGSGWFTTDYRAMTGIAAAVVVPVLLLSIAQSVYRQSAAVLVRSALVQLPLALVLTAVAVQLVQLSLAVTDNLCTAISAGAGANIAQALSGLATASDVAGGQRDTGDPVVRALRRRAVAGVRRVRALARAPRAGRRGVRGGAVPADRAGQPGVAGHLALGASARRHAGRA